ncbi:hypothetical protein ACFVVX_05890 [Kitasatospora sp. NPDC058170]|uniref:hypothetical protein n=1 Tax=Kitasatospora sp. NPDC058170 TaxID=3346364 RepID=UPI0036D89A0A
MYQEPRRPDRAVQLAKSLDAVLRGLTAEQRAFAQRPKHVGPAPVLDDDQSRAELLLISGLAERAIVELQQGNPLNDDDLPDRQRVALTALVAEIRRLTTGHEGRNGRDAMRLVLAWLGGEGGESGEALRDLRDRLRARLKEQASADVAAQPAPAQQQAQAPATNQEVLSGLLRDIIGHQAPGGDQAKVKSILVIDGVAYRGKNGGAVSAVTDALIRRLVTSVEDWTLTGCAEVHALDAFVTSRNYASASDVVKDFTGVIRVTVPPAPAQQMVRGAVIAAMDARGYPTRSWEKRLPCEHCRQWLATLRITADTRGVLS